MALPYNGTGRFRMFATSFIPGGDVIAGDSTTTDYFRGCLSRPGTTSSDATVAAIQLERDYAVLRFPMDVEYPPNGSILEWQPDGGEVELWDVDASFTPIGTGRRQLSRKIRISRTV